MCRVMDNGVPVSEGDIGMMILLDCHVCDRVDEGERAEVVPEFELCDQFLGVRSQVPVWSQFLLQGIGLVSRKWGDAAFAGYATTSGEWGSIRVHSVLLGW